MKTAHRCHHCRRVSRNVMKTYDASAVCGSEVYICLGWKQCRERMESKGKVIIEYAMGNPPKGKRWAGVQGIE